MRRGFEGLVKVREFEWEDSTGSNRVVEGVRGNESSSLQYQELSSTLLCQPLKEGKSSERLSRFSGITQFK